MNSECIYIKSLYFIQTQASSSTDYDEEPYEEEDHPQPQRYKHHHREKNYYDHYSGHSAIGLPPAYTYPPYPGAGYISGGFGQSSAGSGGGGSGGGGHGGPGGGGSGAVGLQQSNKAFIPFFGYVDPIILIAIVAFPVLCTLGITSLLMPIIPIVIYIIGLIFPSSRKLVKSQNLTSPSSSSSSSLLTSSLSSLNETTAVFEKAVHLGKTISLSQPSLRALLWLVEKSIDHWQQRNSNGKSNNRQSYVRKRKKRM